MREGDLARLITGTGGGFGDPLERPVKEVQSDVKNGYITVEQARDLYGVLIDPITFEVMELDPARGIR
jgi:N-methylhydantoinase B